MQESIRLSRELKAQIHEEVKDIDKRINFGTEKALLTPFDSGKSSMKVETQNQAAQEIIKEAFNIEENVIDVE